MQQLALIRRKSCGDGGCWPMMSHLLCEFAASRACRPESVLPRERAAPSKCLAYLGKGRRAKQGVCTLRWGSKGSGGYVPSEGCVREGETALLRTTAHR